MRCIQQIVLLVPGVTYTTLSLPSLRRRRRLPIHPYSTRSHQSLHHPPHLNLRASPLLSILKGSNGTAFHSSQARFPLHVPLASLVSDTYTIRPQNNFQISVGGVKKRRIHECILGSYRFAFFLSPMVYWYRHTQKNTTSNCSLQISLLRSPSPFLRIRPTYFKGQEGEWRRLNLGDAESSRTIYPIDGK
jgi:hypothetical protein